LSYIFNIAEKLAVEARFVKAGRFLSGFRESDTPNTNLRMDMMVLPKRRPGTNLWQDYGGITFEIAFAREIRILGLTHRMTGFCAWRFRGWLSHGRIV